MSEIISTYALIITIFFKGGWVVFLFALFAMFYKLYMDYINLRWYSSQEWVFLKISVPKNNEKSPLAFEQLMNQVHSTGANHHTWAETHIEGIINIWFSWEIVSIGGVISNYVKILKKNRDTLESAIYSQYPAAEIDEVEDYFSKLPKYDPENPEYNIFAFHFKMKSNEAYPIRTYPEFEHSTAKTFVDPATGIWEELGKINPYEIVVLQFLFRPVSDEWKEAGRKLVDHLKGEPEKEKHDVLFGFLGKALGPFIDIFLRITAGEGGGGHAEKPASNRMNQLSGVEKEVIDLVQRKLSKLGFDTKIRFLYMATKEKYNPIPVRTAISGAFKSVNSSLTNGLQPNTHTWTHVHYWLFKKWEEPIVHLRELHRKRNLMRWIRNRWFMGGEAPKVLNTEEIATILHFPSIEVSVPQIDKVTTTKIQPPPELPLAL